MDTPPEVTELGIRLSESAARNTATAITDKIRALKASGKQEETIAGLEALVSQLIDDKAELVRIAQAYQSELVAQRLSPGDVKYISDTVVPLIEQLASASEEDASDALKMIEMLKPLLSVETANVLQILGFNFRKGIGEPLTELTEKKILSNISRSEELQLESAKREQLYIQLALDPEAFARFHQMFSGPTQ